MKSFLFVKFAFGTKDLSLRQLPGDIVPCHAALHHEHADMIQKIGNLVLDLLGIRILGGNDNLCCLFSYFFQDLVNALVEQVVRIRSFLRVFLAVRRW